MTDQPYDDFIEHGDFVTLKATGWLGQVVDFRQMGFNEPEYLLRIWTGSILFKDWFSACEIDPLPEPEPAKDEADNVVNFTEFKARLDAGTKTKGVA